MQDKHRVLPGVDSANAQHYPSLFLYEFVEGPQSAAIKGFLCFLFACEERLAKYESALKCYHPVSIHGHLQDKVVRLQGYNKNSGIWDVFASATQAPF